MTGTRRAAITPDDLIAEFPGYAFTRLAQPIGQPPRYEALARDKTASLRVIISDDLAEIAAHLRLARPRAEG